nr:hypothetical protein CFP56_58175 [Quercus suber]
MLVDQDAYRCKANIQFQRLTSSSVLYGSSIAMPRRPNYQQPQQYSTNAHELDYIDRTQDRDCATPRCLPQDKMQARKEALWLRVTCMRTFDDIYLMCQQPIVALVQLQMNSSEKDMGRVVLDEMLLLWL